MQIGCWFPFNYIFETYTWSRDSRSDKTAKIIYEEYLSKNRTSHNS